MLLWWEKEVEDFWERERGGKETEKSTKDKNEGKKNKKIKKTKEIVKTYKITS